MRSLILILTGILLAIAIAFTSLSGHPTYVAEVPGDADEIPPREVDAPTAPGSPWGEHLNPKGLVYKNGFKVFYFDRTKRIYSAFQHHVDDIAIKYAWDELHGIDSEAFVAYWVGVLRFDEAGIKTIDISLSWSKVRIFLNGKLIHEGSSKESLRHYFDAGENLLEVEYINNWHTTEFKLTVRNDVPRIPLTHLGAALAAEDRSFDGLHYVGLYESGNRDTTVVVSVPSDTRDAVLWLDSYEAINWTLANPDKVAAVITASYSPGSQVVNAGSIPVFQLERGLGIRSIGRSNCHCSGAGFHCENQDDMMTLQTSLQKITGLPLRTFGVTYSAASISTEPLNDAAKRMIKDARERAERAQLLCEERRNPDFDTMFE